MRCRCGWVSAVKRRRRGSGRIRIRLQGGHVVCVGVGVGVGGIVRGQRAAQRPRADGDGGSGRLGGGRVHDAKM
ncbi:hypothetical protein BCR44DRAFT_1439371, partial [Catenaria anguillulae PL171]